MCGIAGIFSGRTTPEDGERLERMLAALRHRGPDSTGRATVSSGVMGQTRLAVIDTSDEGRQPMRRGETLISYNGEVYNFQEERTRLQDEGFSFASGTDTEVLLALYQRYGADFVSRLNGIYAFALYDDRSDTLFCARDPLGIKPLLYAQVDGRLIFASEIRSMLASGLVPREVDPEASLALLIRGSVPQPMTLLRAIRVLPAGHSLTWRKGKVTIRSFAPLTLPRPFEGDYNDMLDHGRALLDEILRQQSVADVPLGAFLSGGIDSSLLVALLSRQHNQVRTFSVGFEPDLVTVTEDESADAALVAEHLGVRHTTVRVEQRDICRNLPSIAADMDHPTVDGVNSWLVSKAASQELTVALSGTGGDELFAGYPWFAAMQESPRRLRWRFWSKQDPFIDRFNGQYLIFTPRQAKRLAAGTTEPVREDPFPTAETLARVTGLLLSGYTRDQLLFDIDTASMAHHLEVRVPLLDLRFVRFALSLPPQAKVSPSNLQAPAGSYAASGVKRLLMDIGRPLLPSGFDSRCKRGFTMPFDAWLRGELKELCRDTLSRETVSRRGIFNPQAVAGVVDDFYAGRTGWTQPWLLMMTELWAREVLDA